MPRNHLSNPHRAEFRLPSPSRSTTNRRNAAPALDNFSWGNIDAITRMPSLHSQEAHQASIGSTPPFLFRVVSDPTPESRPVTHRDEQMDPALPVAHDNRTKKAPAQGECRRNGLFVHARVQNRQDAEDDREEESDGGLEPAVVGPKSPEPGSAVGLRPHTRRRRRRLTCIRIGGRRILNLQPRPLNGVPTAPTTRTMLVSVNGRVARVVVALPPGKPIPAPGALWESAERVVAGILRMEAGRR